MVRECHMRAKYFNLVLLSILIGLLLKLPFYLIDQKTYSKLVEKGFSAVPHPLSEFKLGAEPFRLYYLGPGYDSYTEILIKFLIAPLLESLIFIPFGLFCLKINNSIKKALFIVISVLVITYIAAATHGNNPFPGAALFFISTFYFFWLISKGTIRESYFYIVLTHLVYNLATFGFTLIFIV